MRPTIYDRPMTGAERAARHRERKKRRETKALTVRQAAAAYGISERTVYYSRAVRRFGLPEWDEVIMSDKYGKVSVATLADICKLLDHDAQRHALNMVKVKGWREFAKWWRREVGAMDHMDP